MPLLKTHQAETANTIYNLLFYAATQTMQVLHYHWQAARHFYINKQKAWSIEENYIWNTPAEQYLFRWNKTKTPEAGTAFVVLWFKPVLWALDD